RRRHGGADAPRAASRGRGGRARARRSDRAVDPRGVLAHRVPHAGGARARTAPPRRPAPRVPRRSRCTAMTDRSIGWGKILLLGEPAVVYGYPAPAAALDRGVNVACVPTRPRRNVDMPTSEITGTLRVDVPAWSLAVAADDDHPVGRGLARIADALAI